MLQCNTVTILWIYKLSVLYSEFSTSCSVAPFTILRVQHQDQSAPWCAFLDQFILFTITPGVLLKGWVGNSIGVSSELPLNFSTTAWQYNEISPRIGGCTWYACSPLVVGGTGVLYTLDFRTRVGHVQLQVVLANNDAISSVYCNQFICDRIVWRTRIECSNSLFQSPLQPFVILRVIKTAFSRGHDGVDSWSECTTYQQVVAEQQQDALE